MSCTVECFNTHENKLTCFELKKLGWNLNCHNDNQPLYLDGYAKCKTYLYRINNLLKYCKMQLKKDTNYIISGLTFWLGDRSFYMDCLKRLNTYSI